MTGTTHICIARHGETDWNAAQILQGWIDVPLNMHGRRQSHELADALAHERFSRIYTSPLRRASETADIIAERLGLAVPVRHDGLKERNFGAVQGRPKAELTESHPELMKEILRRNPAAHFEGGESADHFADRVLGGLADIGAHNRGHRVLVITHGWVMDVITRHIRHLPRTEVLNMKRKNIERLWIEVSGHATIREAEPG